MRSLWACLTFSFCAAVVSADDTVPPLPADSTISPAEIFNDPDAVEDAPIELTTQTSNSQMYYVPTSDGPMPFLGYSGGLSAPIDGPIDDLFNLGGSLNIEAGRQFDFGNGNALALTLGLSNQTYFGHDNTDASASIVGGMTYNIDSMTITTVKTGAYLGRALGNLDVFGGLYTKLGIATLNEDTTTFNPAHRNIFVTGVKTEAFAGGFGAEGGINIFRRERVTVGGVFGMDYIYLDTFSGIDKWNAYVHVGMYTSIDTTNGLFDPETRANMQARRAERKNQRMARKQYR